MTLSDVCIKRPVFTWVLVAIPVVLGLFSYGELGVDLFPDVDFPVCTVTTVLQGASVEEMETTVTKPIEDIINTVSGIDEVRSTTTEGVSVVTVQFLLSKNGDVGMQEVRDKVNTILADLPDGTDPPIVDKFDTSSMPVMTIAVSGRRDFREVTELARKQIKERLETVNGVGSINLVGGRVRAMNVVLDIERMAGYNLSVEDVRIALIRQNLEVPGGRMDQGARELVLRTLGRLRTQKEFNNLIVANRNGYPIRVSDVGRAEDAFEEPRSQARLDGDSAVSLVVQKQSGVNTVKVVEDVKARLEALEGRPPRRHHHRGHSRSVAVHQKVDRGSQIPPPSRRRAGLGHHPPLHPRLAHHLDRHPGDSDVNYTDLYVHALYGIHAQQHHDARLDPGDRHRDRRRGGRS